MALALGDNQQIKQITNKDQQIFLADPQQLNSYSYAANNPIVKSDPTGNIPVIGAVLSWLFLNPIVESPYTDINPTSKQIASAKQTELGFVAVSLAVSGNAGGKVSSKALQAGESVVQNGLQWSKGRFGSSAENLGSHFIDHEKELRGLGINSTQKMYDKAMDLTRSIDNKNTFDFMSPFVKGGLDVYNKGTNLIVGLNKNLEISTLHTITDPKKFEVVSNQISKIINKVLKK